MHIDCIRFWWA